MNPATHETEGSALVPVLYMAPELSIWWQLEQRYRALHEKARMQVCRH